MKLIGQNCDVVHVELIQGDNVPFDIWKSVPLPTLQALGKSQNISRPHWTLFSNKIALLEQRYRKKNKSKTYSASQKNLSSLQCVLFVRTTNIYIKHIYPSNKNCRCRNLFVARNDFLLDIDVEKSKEDENNFDNGQSLSKKSGPHKHLLVLVKRGCFESFFMSFI